MSHIEERIRMVTIFSQVFANCKSIIKTFVNNKKCYIDSYTLPMVNNVIQLTEDLIARHSVSQINIWLMNNVTVSQLNNINYE